MCDSIFRGDKVRTCVIDNKRMVSVYDVIAIVTGEPDQVWRIYHRLCKTHPVIKSLVFKHQFPWPDRNSYEVWTRQGSGSGFESWRQATVEKIITGRAATFLGYESWV